MAFERVVSRMLPDGSTRKVYPFHISLEGMESVLLCRDNEDYDQLEKAFYLSAYKNNSLVITHIAMSNHGHLGLLAPSMETALLVGENIKKHHSQYISWKYNEPGILSRSHVDIQYLDSDWYVRHALAYIPRNANDTGYRIEDYPWSGYRGLFMEGKSPLACRRVSSLSRREREALFRTHLDLSCVPWLINAQGSIEPASACDWRYLESAFDNDQAFFLKMIGSVNVAEMQQKLQMNKRVRHTDAEMLAIIANLADKFCHRSIPDLTPDMKARILPYLYRGYRTSIPQLARCLQMSREVVVGLIPMKRGREKQAD